MPAVKVLGTVAPFFAVLGMAGSLLSGFGESDTDQILNKLDQIEKQVNFLHKDMDQ